MKIRWRTRERKLYDHLTENSKWKKVFIVWPRKVNQDNGYAEYQFLTHVFRKGTIRLRYTTNGDKLTIEYKYAACSEGFKAAVKDSSELEFKNYQARDAYRSLKEKL